ncbi:MAG: response regulator transcription factor [Bernardetiaceae bacterium]
MPEKNHKILIVDDEPDILELLQYNLENAGYQVETARDGEDALKKCDSFAPQLILMDIMMPRMDGVEACRRIRSNPDHAGTYIIFLTARTEEYSEVAAFEGGADDYLTKPIKPRALVSRIKAYFRRDQLDAGDDQETVIEIADFIIDKSSYTIRRQDQEITLPKKEFELLYFLAKNPERVYSREDLLKNIWGTDVYVLARTVDVHIRRIREKVGSQYIRTIKGVGYKFVANP